MQKKFMKRVGILLCCALLLALLPTAGWAEVVRDGQGNISYKPIEQGKFSKGGYTIDKISHPTRGAGEVDAILTGKDQDRGNTYSWSMADGGEDSEYIYIGTGYNSTFYIYHNNVKTSLDRMQKAGTLPSSLDTDKAAEKIVEVMFGVDKFDKSKVNAWRPVIIAVSKKTGEAEIIFREADHWGDNQVFPRNWNALSGYRMPGAKNVALLLWEKAKDFLQRAFTVIFVATILIWFLQTFDMRLQVVADSHDSLLSAISGLLAPLFAPLGFGDWRVVTSLVSGFMAKESVVSSLVLLYGSTEVLLASLTPLAAASLLVFSLLYTPCVAAVSSIKRELGGKWAVGVVVGQCAIAWIAAFIVRIIGLALGGI